MMNHGRDRTRALPLVRRLAKASRSGLGAESFGIPGTCPAFQSRTSCPAEAGAMIGSREMRGRNQAGTMHRRGRFRELCRLGAHPATGAAAERRAYSRRQHSLHSRPTLPFTIHESPFTLHSSPCLNVTLFPFRSGIGTRSRLMREVGKTGCTALFVPLACCPSLARRVASADLR